MPFAIAGVIGVGGTLGAIAGSQAKKSSSSQTSGITQNPTLGGGFEQGFFGQQQPVFDAKTQAEYDRWSNISNDPSASPEDRKYAEQQRQQLYGQAQSYTTSGGAGADLYTKLQNLIQAGPGQSDVSNSYNANKSLADLLGSYSQSGGLPNQQDISASNDVAKNLFAARQVGLNQSFIDQTTDSNRVAASLGRSINDPILQAKLRTGFMRQQDSLSAEQQGTAQQLALALPGQRVGYAQGQAGVLGGLANSAFSNQNFLLGLGNQLGSQERGYRLDTSERYQNGSTASGGGLGGAIAGAAGGAGAALGIASSFAGPSPTPNPTGGFGGYSGGFNPSSYNATPTQFTPSAGTLGAGF